MTATILRYPDLPMGLTLLLLVACVASLFVYWVHSMAYSVRELRCKYERRALRHDAVRKWRRWWREW